MHSAIFGSKMLAYFSFVSKITMFFGEHYLSYVLLLFYTHIFQFACERSKFAQVTHACVRSWNQPVLSNSSKESCSKKHRQPSIGFELMTDQFEKHRQPSIGFELMTERFEKHRQPSIGFELMTERFEKHRQPSIVFELMTERFESDALSIAPRRCSRAIEHSQLMYLIMCQYY